LDNKKIPELTKIITDAVNDGINLALKREIELKGSPAFCSNAIANTSDCSAAK